MTASERAAQINAQDPDNAFKLVEDDTHWARYKIYTGVELDHYLAVQLYVNLYKDEHGIKPRWIDFSAKSTAEVQDMIDRDFPPAVEEPPVVEVPPPAPLTFSPFAALSGLKLKP
jgi:hypothetical protein